MDCQPGKETAHKHIEGARLKYQEKHQPFEYLHSDIFGPVPSSAITKYFVTFIDEKTSYILVFPLKEKSTEIIIDITVRFVKTIDRQFSVKVKAFQFDHGSEYNNKIMLHYLNESRMQDVFTTDGDPRSHGVAEILNLIFLNDYRTLLKTSRIPPHFSIYAVQISATIRKTVCNKRIKTSPQALTSNSALDVTTIKAFGQPVIVHLTTTPSNLHYRGEQGYELFPSQHSRSYHIYIPKDHKVVDSMNYAVIRSNDTNESSEEYNTYIFDDIINKFTSNKEHILL